MARLQILICTTAVGIAKLHAERLPAMPGVEYIICCQNSGRIDINADIVRLKLNNTSDGVSSPRNDITIYQWTDSGLSRNRNHAFDVATAPLLLIADDDLTFKPEGIAQLIAAFDAEPDVDIITTRADMPERRKYPADGHDLSMPYAGYSPVSFEIAMRGKVGASVRFNTNYGIGSGRYGCGEEEIFLHEALKAGYKGRYSDICAVEHPGPTTSVHSATRPDIVRAKGAVMRRLRGPVAALIRLPLEALRSPISTITALRYLWYGYLHP